MAVGPAVVALLCATLVLVATAAAATTNEPDPHRAQETSAFAIDLPAPPGRNLGRYRELSASLRHEELYAIDETGEFVSVLTPDGGTLRTFGAGILIDATDVAVVYGTSNPRAEDGRIFVTDAGAGEVHVFTYGGESVRAITGFDRPVGIAALSMGAIVIDAGSRTATRIDFEGLKHADWDAVTFVDPVSIATIADNVAIADRARRTVSWYTSDGGLQLVLDLPLAPNAIAIDYPTSGNMTAAGVFATDGDRLVRARKSPPGETDIVDLDVLADDLLSIASATDQLSCGTLCGPLTLYLLDNTRGVMPFFTSGDGTVRSGCELLSGSGESLSTEPIRMASMDGALVIGYTNGHLLEASGLDSGGALQFLGNVGAFDDLTAINDELLLTRAGELRRVHSLPAGLGVTADVAPWSWPYQPDCFVAGEPGVPSLSASGSNVNVTVPGWFKSLGNGRLDFDATTIMKRYTRGPSGWDWRLGRSEGALWLFGGEFRPAGPPILITDVAALDNGTVLAVDRQAGALLKFNPDVDRLENRSPTKIHVPGRPTRVVVDERGHAFVLTAEGAVYEVDETGSITNAWDARSLGDGDFADIAVMSGFVVVLDREGSRILLFDVEPTPPADWPVLPERCTLVGGKSAWPNRLPLGNETTVTLRLGGECGRASDASDILLLLKGPILGWDWGRLALSQLITDFLQEVDWAADRVGVMAFDRGSPVVVDLTHDEAAVAQAVAAMPESVGLQLESRPIRDALRYIETVRRSDAELVIINVAPSPYVHTPISHYAGSSHFREDASAARERGVRIVTITESIVGAYVAGAVAHELEDFYVAPSAATLTSIYRQLGREYSAHWLARTAVIEDAIPDNMRYIEGSAQPPADWNPDQRILRWAPDQVPFEGWSATYSLVPMAVGEWRTNDYASAEFVDGFGNDGALTFPLPEVLVEALPSWTPTPAVTTTPTAPPTKAPSPLFLPSLAQRHCTPRETPVEVVLVMDASSSMMTEVSEGRTRMDEALAAATHFVLLKRPNDRIGVVSFSSVATLNQGLTSDYNAVRDALSSITIGTETRIDMGLRLARDELAQSGGPGGAAQAIVLLTDGRANPGGPESAIREADLAKLAGVTLYAVGLGPEDEVDAVSLRRIASGPDTYYHTPDANALEGIFGRIAAAVPCSIPRFADDARWQ